VFIALFRYLAGSDLFGAWRLEPLNTDSCDVKIGLLSFVLAWRFLEFYSLPELVTCHFPSRVKAYSDPAECLERHLTTSVLALLYDVTLPTF
jgi:hypothetical protein